MISEKLLNWYNVNKRPLPWRTTRDPYCIWLSEIMAQQTRIDTMLTYYEKFLHEFPRIEDFARAEEDRILKLWEGLGYYSRAKNMLKCAKVIVEKYGGEFPKNLKEMKSLPGIGDYTAGAILSIAYDMPVPAVDGNVMRVFSRYFGIKEDISIPKTKEIFEQKVIEVIPAKAGDFNQSIMELGALICLPQNPKCQECPLESECYGRLNHLTGELPFKSTRIIPTEIEMAVGVVRIGDLLLLMKREEKGLLASLWGFPIVESKEEEGGTKLLQSLKSDMDLQEVDVKERGRVKHVFTHRVWNMRVYEITGENLKILEEKRQVLVDENDLYRYSLPTAFKKVLIHLKK